MDNKLSVKFESGLYEQTYKFRVQEGLEKMQDVEKLVDPPFISAVESILKNMHKTRMEAMRRKFTGNREDEFEEII